MGVEELGGVGGEGARVRLGGVPFAEDVKSVAERL